MGRPIISVYRLQQIINANIGRFAKNNACGRRVHESPDSISINHNFANATTRLVLIIAFPKFTRTEIRVWFLLWKVSRVYRCDSPWFKAYTCYGTLWSVFSRHAVILQVITEARNHHREGRVLYQQATPRDETD